MLSQERHTARAVRAVAGAVVCVRDEPGAAVLVWGHDPDHDPDRDHDSDPDPDHDRDPDRDHDPADDHDPDPADRDPDPADRDHDPDPDHDPDHDHDSDRDPDRDPDRAHDPDRDRRFCFNPRIVGLLHDPERLNGGLHHVEVGRQRLRVLPRLVGEVSSLVDDLRLLQ